MSIDSKHIASHTMRLVVISLIVLVVVAIAFFLVIQSFDQIRAFIEEDVERNIRTIVSNSELSRSLASLEIDINQMMIAAIGQPEN